MGPTLRFLAQRQPKLGLVSWPLFEPEPLLLPPRRNVQRHQRSFNHQRTGTAHQVHKVTTVSGNLWPPCPQQQSRCKVFFQGRDTLFGSVAPHMKAVTTQINPQRQAAPVQPRRYRDIRVFRRNRGPGCTGTPNAVNNAIFHFLGAKLSVPDGFVLAKKRYPEAPPRGYMGLPVKIHDTGIKFVGAPGIHIRHIQNHPVRQTGPQAGPIATLQLALNPDTSGCIPHKVQAEFFQFIGQEVLDAFGAGYEKDMLGQDQLLVF